MINILNRVCIMFNARFPEIDLSTDHVAKIDKWLTKFREEEFVNIIPTPEPVVKVVNEPVVKVVKVPPSRKKKLNVDSSSLPVVINEEE